MPRLPTPTVLAFAARRRVLRALGRERDPFADIPQGLALSPSARHFVDYDTAPLSLRFTSGRWNDATAWQHSARSKLAELAGYGRNPTPIKMHDDDVLALNGGLSRRRIYLRVRPGVDVPVNLIESPTSSALRPVMICLQGTNTGAHLSWGEVQFPDDVDKRQKGYDIARQAADRGYLAVAVEQSCFGERTERQVSPRSPGPCIDATMHALLLGRSLLGERCSDVSAVVDWLLTQQHALKIDPARIHIMGHSSGGTTAMFSAALDPRISAVLACGCLGFFRDTIGRRRDDSGQAVVPGILNWMEMADVVGLIAPRPFVTVAGETDHIWPASAAEAVVGEARAVYAAMSAAELAICVTQPGGHVFRPEVSWHTFTTALNRQVPKATVPQSAS